MPRYFSEATIEQIRRGFYSAVYFNRTKEILLSQQNLQSVTMQVFQRQEGSVLCGMEEVKELFNLTVGYYNHTADPCLRRQAVTQVSQKNLQNPPIAIGVEASEDSFGSPPSRHPFLWYDQSREIKIDSLQDGDILSSLQPVLHITGPYAYFAHLESIYLGILARRTLVSTNIRSAVTAAAGKSVIFFADRFDYFLNQEGDGYAAKVGGAAAVCTEAQATVFGKEPVGTIPHALIAMYGGDTVAATEAFSHQYPQVHCIALVDFDNDCVETSLAVAKKLGKKLWGVRIDTSLNMIDLSLCHSERSEESQSGEANANEILRRKTPQDDKRGVNPTLIRMVRQALDQEGFPWVKIVASGGFTPERIAQFEQEKTPVDVYGIGSAMLKGQNDFTADIVLVDGKPMAKKGREFRKLEVRS